MTSEHDSEQGLAAAITHLRAGRLLDAERQLRAVCAANPNHARAFHLAGVVAHQLRRNDAVLLLDRAVSIDPRSAEAHNDRGAVLAANGLFPQALDSFEKAVKLRPDYVEARNNVAGALQSLGRPAEAAAQLERVLKASPTSPPAHFQLAAALEATGDLARAE
jgi:Tfp pilus assembly protein PilF